MSDIALEVVLQDSFWRIVRRHLVRVVLSAIAAIPVFLIGTELLHYEVSQQDVNPMAAYMVNWPIITLLAFVVNLFIWIDRGPDIRQAINRWLVASVVHAFVSYSLFTLMVWAFNWPYLKVSVGLTIILGACSYVARSEWIFRRKCQEAIG